MALSDTIIWTKLHRQVKYRISLNWPPVSYFPPWITDVFALVRRLYFTPYIWCAWYIWTAAPWSRILCVSRFSQSKWCRIGSHIAIPLCVASAPGGVWGFIKEAPSIQYLAMHHRAGNDQNQKLVTLRYELVILLFYCICLKKSFTHVYVYMCGIVCLALCNICAVWSPQCYLLSTGGRRVPQDLTNWGKIPKTPPILFIEPHLCTSFHNFLQEKAF